MKDITISDLEELLSFNNEIKSSDFNPNKMIDKRIIYPLRALQRQADHLRLYSNTRKTAESFLTEPSGLILYAKEGDLEFYGWKFPNLRAGTRDIEFILEQGKIQYEKEKYLKAQISRNPSADYPQIIKTFEEAKKKNELNTTELLLTAYENNIYLEGELENLKDDVNKTKTIMIIDNDLGPVVKPHYSFSLDDSEAQFILERIEMHHIIENLMKDNTPDRLDRMRRDLNSIIDNDPRRKMVNYSKILLNEIGIAQRKYPIANKNQL